jgi:diguanylate cyclase (GGDEF)-like protein
MPASAAVIVCVSVWQFSLFSRHNAIEQLGQLPDQSVVHVVGAVIRADKSLDHVWIEDATGAVPVSLSKTGAKVRVGETVSMEGRLTRRPAPAADLNEARGHARGRGARTRTGAHGPATGQGAGHAVRSASLLTGTAPDAMDGVSIENAAPLVAVTGTKVEALYAHWIALALPAALFVLLWLGLLYERERRQARSLTRSAKTDAAIRELAAAMQRLTQEAIYNSEVPAVNDPEVAPLAAGFNAMIAELQKRDGIRRDAELRLRRMTLMDDLTGLPNRRLLSDRLSQSLARSKRDQKMVALLCLDLDDLKLVNDRYGNGMGDALLAQVAQRLKTRFRRADTIARIGGDEFALILDEMTDRDEAKTFAEEVQEALKEPFEVDGHRVQTGARIGIGIFPDAVEGGQLLQQADCAMYAAKRSGKTRIVQFGDDLGIAARERLTLERELHNAIAKGEISLDYQPEVDFATNQIVRFEALARWTHPELGLILPAVFIPLAEEAGLITTLGSYIMERACTDAAGWQTIAGREIQVAVNVSSVQFARDTFFEEVADVLQRTGLEPHLLQVELTESATVNGMERAADMMRRLKRMGVSVAVDDFGTGYSCLTYLPKLPFDTLKLDKSFVNEMMVRRETKAFVGSIVTLARDLDMKVIAEGIETPEQLRALRALGSDAGQGFLLGRPSGNPIALLSTPVA